MAKFEDSGLVLEPLLKIKTRPKEPLRWSTKSETQILWPFEYQTLKT